MGWIKCLGCKGKVSDSAQACPHCGMPFTHGAPPSPSPLVISQPKTSGMAIGSLVCGILGICLGLPAPVGLILGIIAIRQINSSAGII
ncbi:MAG: DUF4190 domain-containing protein, partial [Pedosphaera sp.]|nr:DUF4190 domain-containing protein [Pedosphaera sp.]